jgi:hypothetical protein
MIFTRWNLVIMPLLLLLLALASNVFAIILLPNLTGPGLVGTVSLELVDWSRTDPLAPTPRPRDLMVSVFYRKMFNKLS